jgi:hypothetical protein
MFEVFEDDVLEILRRFALYLTIDKFLYHRAREGIPWRCTAWRHRPGQWRLGRCPRKVTTPGGPVWAKSVERSGPVVKISKETTWAIKVNRAELIMGCSKFFSKFSNKDLGFKVKDFKFQTKIELGSK